MTRRLLPLALAALCAGAAAAHPGHGAPRLWRSPLHYLLEPEHLFVLAALALGAAGLARRRLRDARRRTP
jgi:hypothetical protein